MLTTEQFLDAQKATFDALFQLSSKGFEGVEQLVELNVRTARDALGEASSASQALLSVKQPQDVWALQASLAQPAAERATAYARSVYQVAATTGAEVGRVAQAVAADAQTRFMSAVDSAARNAPAGTENVLSFVRSGAAAANNAIENAQKAVAQMAETADANVQAMTATVTGATQAATKARRGA
ncbi:phasin family protein [Piscinibacter koreensis]|uniref:Phasin family protein n=1 Tax=Piscinibacter koreensis TaxID=2742824 RepID=A0A7Y6NMX7_9BURK|nr:phasin family protein [Schlegelella koreensis]NUZ06056.1 phasin family protein [Schlegelella koreensis]